MTKFDTSFGVYGGHLDRMTAYVRGITPILANNRQMLPVFIESTVVLLQAWQEDFLQSLVSTAAREKEPETREYFRKHARKAAMTCDLPTLLAMARGRINYEKACAPIADFFVQILGFSPWPDQRCKEILMDLNFARQLIVHHPSGVVGDDFYVQFTDKTLLSETRYGDLAVRRLDHLRLVPFVLGAMEAVRDQTGYLRQAMIDRPEWRIETKKK